VLLWLIGRKLYELARDWRLGVPGSRMKARAVLMSSALALAPILVVYMFSVSAIGRGIDSWFDVNVGRGLDDALALSRAALSLRVREFSNRTRSVAEELRTARDFELISQLDRLRRFAGGNFAFGQFGREFGNRELVQHGRKFHAKAQRREEFFFLCEFGGFA